VSNALRNREIIFWPATSGIHVFFRNSGTTSEAKWLKDKW